MFVADAEDWEAGVARYRSGMKDAATASGQAVASITSGKRCVADVAREQYRLRSDVGARSIDWQPIGVCSGCPHCGSRTQNGPAVAAGFSQPIEALLEAVPRFCSTTDGSPADVLVRCTSSREVRQTIQRLVEMGFPLVVGSDIPLDDDAWRATLRSAPLGWVITEQERVRSGIPAVVVLPDVFPPSFARTDAAGTVLLASERSTSTGDKFPLTQLRAWIPPSRIHEEVIRCPS